MQWVVRTCVPPYRRLITKTSPSTLKVMVRQSSLRSPDIVPSNVSLTALPDTVPSPDSGSKHTLGAFTSHALSEPVSRLPVCCSWSVREGLVATGPRPRQRAGALGASAFLLRPPRVFLAALVFGRFDLRGLARPLLLVAPRLFLAPLLLGLPGLGRAALVVALRAGRRRLRRARRRRRLRRRRAACL